MRALLLLASIGIFAQGADSPPVIVRPRIHCVDDEPRVLEYEWTFPSEPPSVVRFELETAGEVEESSQELLGKARRAMGAIADYDQPTVDRICQAIAWATANMPTSVRLANMIADIARKAATALSALDSWT